MPNRLLTRLPAAVAARRDVLDGRERWVDARVLAAGDASAVLAAPEGGGTLLWAVGDADELTGSLPTVLQGLDEHVRWATFPRAVHVPAVALAAAGLVRDRSWDRLVLDAPPAVHAGEPRVAQLDLAVDRTDVDACLDVANPTTRTRPGAPDDAGWWGVRGPDGALLGVVGLSHRPGGTRHLHGLAVVPEARGQGLGAALTVAAARHALDGGAPWVSLGTYTENTVARRLYARLGFVVDAENTGYRPAG